LNPQAFAVFLRSGGFKVFEQIQLAGGGIDWAVQADTELSRDKSIVVNAVAINQQSIAVGCSDSRVLVWQR
jgi:hypothetical protein